MVSVMAGRSDALPGAPFSIGIHPWQLGGEGFDTGAALREVETAPAVAIGEIGLDGAISADLDEQSTIFVAQLRIARQRGVPVILHCVRTFEPTMELLAAHTPPAAIFHGFVGSPEQAARAIGAGYYLSFGERSLDSAKTVEAMRRTPIEHLFLETDDDPTPIDRIYTRVAQTFDRPVEQLATQIETNYERVVGKNRTVVR